MARYYEYNKLPDAKERAALGQAVGLSARAVQVWFQNRRQRKPSGPASNSTWVPMDSAPTNKPAERVGGPMHNVPPTPSTQDTLGPEYTEGGGLMQPQFGQSADAIVAAIRQKAANLQCANVPDPEQVERERALATAVAHARQMQEKGAARDRALGYSPALPTPPPALEQPVQPPLQPPSLPSYAPSAEPIGSSRLSMLGGMQNPLTNAAFGGALGMPSPAARLDPAQLLSMEAQSRSLELRAALLDAAYGQGKLSRSPSPPHPPLLTLCLVLTRSARLDRRRPRPADDASAHPPHHAPRQPPVQPLALRSRRPPLGITPRRRRRRLLPAIAHAARRPGGGDRLAPDDADALARLDLVAVVHVVSLVVRPLGRRAVVAFGALGQRAGLELRARVERARLQLGQQLRL